MVKQEWKELIHNTWFKIVMIAIIIIPCVYAGVFLGSMCNPYGNSGSIPIAIVNEDKLVVYNEQTLNVGEELVKNLKDNDSMDFHFVGQQEVSDGLTDGSYYMIITIPSDFSKNATTLLDRNTQKMILNYTTNLGTNYTASKMDDSAIAKIKSEVSTSVTKTYAKTIFEQIKTLSTSSLSFQDGSNVLTQGLKDYLNGSITVHNGVYCLKNGLDQLNDKTFSLIDGSQQLSSGTNSLLKQPPTLINGINDLDKGANDLYKGISQLIDNNSKLPNGSNALTRGALQISEGSQKLYAGSTTLDNGLKDAKIGVNTLSTSLDDGAKKSQIETNDETFSMLASPIETKHQEISVVENNGHAMPHI